MWARELEPLAPGEDQKPRPKRWDAALREVSPAQLAVLLVATGIIAFLVGGAGHRTKIEVLRDPALPVSPALPALPAPPAAAAAPLRDQYGSCASEAMCCPGGAGSTAGVVCGAADCQGPGGAPPCPGAWMLQNCPQTCAAKQQEDAKAGQSHFGAPCHVPEEHHGVCSGMLLSGHECQAACTKGSPVGDKVISCKDGVLTGDFTCEGFAAEEFCHQECLQAGFCCNDPNVGSNQYLSCAQACLSRARGASEDVCEAACHEPQEGCTRTIEGFSYAMCGTCKDLQPTCPYGVMDTTPCTKGCRIVHDRFTVTPQHGYRFTTKRGRNVADCDGLYELAPHEGKVNDKPVYLNKEKSKFLAFDGAAWVVAALPYLPYAKQGTPVIGYHAGGGAHPDGEWADYKVTEVAI